MKNLTIISGASRGIGKAIADDLSEKKISDILVRLEGRKTADFTDYNSVNKNMINDLKVHLLPLADMEVQINLILCAGKIGTPFTTDPDGFLDLYKVNVLGNLALVNAIMGFNFQKVRIVWFAGGGAAFPFPQFPAYSASKVAVVRTVENLSIILKQFFDDVSIIALAPGAVDTDMLKQTEAAKVEIRTRTDISEPVNFVRNFITDQFDSKKLNGRFMHVRDDFDDPIKLSDDCFKLRRIE